MIIIFQLLAAIFVFCALILSMNSVNTLLQKYGRAPEDAPLPLE